MSLIVLRRQTRVALRSARNAAVLHAFLPRAIAPLHWIEPNRGMNRREPRPLGLGKTGGKGGPSGPDTSFCRKIQPGHSRFCRRTLAPRAQSRMTRGRASCRIPARIRDRAPPSQNSRLSITKLQKMTRFRETGKLLARQAVLRRNRVEPRRKVRMTMFARKVCRRLTLLVFVMRIRPVLHQHLDEIDAIRSE